MKEFILVLSMWGQNVTGTWEYIGNQYVYNNPMTQEVCEKTISRSEWSVHLDNDFYRLQFDCQHVSKENK